MTIIRKIVNKERCGYRGKKQRYSVWRAELNKKWERADEAMVRRICQDNNLDIDECMSQEKRNTWEHTYCDLRNKGYNMIGVSIKDLISEIIK